MLDEVAQYLLQVLLDETAFSGSSFQKGWRQVGKGQPSSKYNDLRSFSADKLAESALPFPD